jgi:Ca2+-binding RTX toxin-like protein
MANNTYVVDQLVKGATTYLEVDDPSGTDWLTIGNVYPDDVVVFNLQYTYESGRPLSATGVYTIGATSFRLVVNGIVDNVRGSNGIDDISGSERGNVLYGDHARTGPGDSDVIFGAGGADTIYGGAGNDSINGAEGRDVLYGDAGNDTISGSLSVDVIYGDAGKDTLDGGAQNGDMVVYSESDAGINIKLTQGSATKGSGGFAQGDTISGFTAAVGSKFNDVITDTRKETIAFGYNDNMFDGGNGNDKLTLGGGNDIGIGGAGNDTINGGIGSDKLTGNAGKDILTGGGDADRFIFLSVSDSTVKAKGQDRILDFSHGQHDRVDLSAIDANSKKGHDQAFHLIGEHAFSGHAGELSIKASGHGFLVQGDVNGDKHADFAIFVDDISKLTSADFML